MTLPRAHGGIISLVLVMVLQGACRIRFEQNETTRREISQRQYLDEK